MNLHKIPTPWSELSENAKYGYQSQPEAAALRAKEFADRKNYIQQSCIAKFPGFLFGVKRRSK